MITLDKNRNSRSYSRSTSMVKHIKISDENWESLRKLDGGSFNDKITKLLGKEISPKAIRRPRTDALLRLPNEVIDAFIISVFDLEHRYDMNSPVGEMDFSGGKKRSEIVTAVGEALEDKGWLKLYSLGYPDDWKSYRSKLSIHIDNRIKALNKAMIISIIKSIYFISERARAKESLFNKYIDGVEAIVNLKAVDRAEWSFFHIDKFKDILGMALVTRTADSTHYSTVQQLARELDMEEERL